MNLDFASVWEMVADLVPENDALICGEEIVSWKDYDHRSSKVASALVKAGLGPNSKAGLYLNNSNEYLIGQNAIFKIGGVPINVGEPLVIDRYRENDGAGSSFVIIEEGNTGDEGDRLSTEDLGTALLLEDRDRILHEEDIQIDEIVLNATDSSSTDAGDNIINESGIDFSNDNVTITDSSGASATIVSADISTGTLSVDTQK